MHTLSGVAGAGGVEDGGKRMGSPGGKGRGEEVVTTRDGHMFAKPAHGSEQPLRRQVGTRSKVEQVQNSYFRERFTLLRCPISVA